MIWASPHTWEPMCGEAQVTAGYRQLALYALVAGVALLALSPLARKLLGEVK